MRSVRLVLQQPGQHERYANDQLIHVFVSNIILVQESGL